VDTQPNTSSDNSLELEETKLER